jgi:hypothetical protein
MENNFAARDSVIGLGSGPLVEKGHSELLRLYPAMLTSWNH